MCAVVLPKKLVKEAAEGDKDSTLKSSSKKPKKNPRRSKRVTFAKKQRRKNKNEATKDVYLNIDVRIILYK